MKFKLFVISLSLLTWMSCKKDEQVTLDCLPVGLQNGLIAYYPFNNGSLSDESTQNNDLTNTTTAAPTADRLGNSTCAFGFQNTSGITEFLTRTQTTFLNSLSSFSISLWYKPLDASVRPGGIYETLVGRGNNGNCPDRSGEWSLGLYDCRRTVFGHDNSVWADPSTNPFISCENEIIAQSDSWIHAVAVKNVNSFSIFINGVLHEQANGPADCGFGNHVAQDLGDLFVGTDFTGAIDDILIFNRAISGQEVADLHNLTACCE